MNTHISPSSAQAFAKISNPERKTLADLVAAIVAQSQRNGALNLSGREIQQSLEQHHGLRVDMSTLSGRINALVTAGRLVRAKDARTCTVTGQNIHPVAATPHQPGLCY